MITSIVDKESMVFATPGHFLLKETKPGNIFQEYITLDTSEKHFSHHLP